MTITVRTFDKYLDVIIKKYEKGRTGFVIRNVVTRDIEEYVISFIAMVETLSICNMDDVTLPICLRRYNNKYDLIFLVKVNREQYVPLDRIKNLDNNIVSFREYLKINNLIKEN